MAQIKGEDAKIVIGSDTMAYVKTMDISFSNNTVERKYFQDDASTFIKAGETCTISVTGDYDSTDTAQAALITALFTDTATVSGIKFYEDDTNYMTATSIQVSSFNTSFDASDIVGFTAEFQLSGDISRTS